MEPRSSVPLCLPSNFTWDPRNRQVKVDKRKARGDITLCKEGLAILESVKNDFVVVICITGPARTGKSYFMSQIQEGVTFELGHSTTSKTTGIWIALAPNSVTVNGKVARLVLLDAEGLGSTSTIDHDGSTERWDRKVFTLCALFSSYLIYNSKGVPTSDDLDKLGFIAQFSSSIHCHSPSTRESTETAAIDIAPYFMWLIRDALLQPEVDGTSCSWETFIKTSVLADGVKNRRNAIKRAICTSFRHFDAYGLPPPSVEPEVVQNLLLPKYRERVNKIFLTKIQDVKRHVLSCSQVKMIQGRQITGQLLAMYVSSCVTAVNHECDKLLIPNAWDSFLEVKWNDILIKSMVQYDKHANKFSFPVSSEDIESFHANESYQVQSTFTRLEASNFDETSVEKYRKKLDLALKEKLQNIKNRNNKESRNYCENIARNLEKMHFESKLETGEHSYTDLVKAKKMVIEKYLRKSKGPVMKDVLKETEERMDGKITMLQPALIQTAIENVERDYEKEALTNIEEHLPLETKELDAKHEGIRKICVKRFQEKCRKCDGFQKALSRLETELRKRLESLRKTNLSRSHDVCEEAMRTSKRKYFDPRWNIASELNIADLNAAKENVLEEYEREACGPAKGKVKKKYSRDMDDQLCQAKPLISQHALSEAEKEYKRLFDQLLQDGPIDSDEATKKCKSVCLKIRERFKTRCEGLDDALSRRYNEQINRILTDAEDKFHRQNAQLSKEYCENLMTQLIRDNLKPPMDNIEMLVSYEKIKEVILEKYRLEPAKGPSSDQVRDEYVLQIDRDIERANQLRVLKGINIGLDAMLVAGTLLLPFGGNAAKVGLATTAAAKLAKDVTNTKK